MQGEVRLNLHHMRMKWTSEKSQKLKMSVWVEGTFGGHLDQCGSNFFLSLYLDLKFFLIYDLIFFFLKFFFLILDLDLIIFSSLDLDLNILGF